MRELVSSDNRGSGVPPESRHSRASHSCRRMTHGGRNRECSTPPEDGRYDDVEADERSAVDHIGAAVDRHYRHDEN